MQQRMAGFGSLPARLGVASILGVCGLFAGLSPAAGAAACPNEDVRGGTSARLPDCRAYELVTPADMGGAYPMERTLSSPRQYFALFAIAPSGESVVFQTEGGVVPGFSGSGSDDRYEAVRGPGGWTSTLDGPAAAQSETPGPGGVSVDHGYSFVSTAESGLADNGSLNQEAGVAPHESSSWVRYPDGSFKLVGRGEIATDPNACGDFIAPGASHIVFDNRDCSGTGAAGPRLRSDSPPVGIQAVYDRTPAGLHTVSLLPGDGIPTENAFFQGTSADGSVVLFSIGANSSIGSGSVLYARVDNAETVEVASGSGGIVTPAGLSDSGDRAFYVQAGNIQSFDTTTQVTTPVADTGDAEPVNIAADGSRVYFVSRSEISGKGVSGEPNLFVWDESTGVTSLVATVASADVEGEPCLTCWTRGPAARRMDFIEGPGAAASRSTPDGAALAFESAAKLTSYDNEGHTEIYLYDALGPSLTCASCNPLGPPTADARLQAFNPFLPVGPPYAYLDIGNLTEDGSTVFFETGEALTATDTDGVADVYEWKGGTISLITSGRSPSDNFLYGVTPDGHDVIFATNDTLLPRDHTGGSGSIYDARVNGGFPEPAAPACEADACQGQPAIAPGFPAPASASFDGRGNLRPRHRCRARRHHARHRPLRHARRCRHGKRRVPR